MTPPFFRSKSSSNNVVFDPALDDAELVRVRDATAGGRWSDARDLLRRTGEDWELRDHRLVVLAQAASDVGWTQEWRELEPDSTDAAVLHALSTVHLVTRGRAGRAEAEGACLVAAEMAPHTPTPWLAMLILARHSGSDDQRVRAFDEVRARSPWHHHAHRLITECLAERRPEAGDDPYHDVYQFADDVARAAPPGTGLQTLPLVALTERHRVLADGGQVPGDPTEVGWSQRRAQQCIAAAFDWWLDRGRAERPHPRLMSDLNFLAHAKYVERRRPQAAALFNAIGVHATPAPWSYGGRDARRMFRKARGWTLDPGAA